MLHSITRQNIESEGSIRHRVVVRFFDGRKNIIVAVVEADDPAVAYRAARKRAQVKGRVPVEVLPDAVEDFNERFH